MKRRIFGFQRRVWWPKWTPASSSSRMETTDIGSPFLVAVRSADGARVEPTSAERRHRHPRMTAGSRVESGWNGSRKPLRPKPAYAQIMGVEGSPPPSLERLADEI